MWILLFIQLTLLEQTVNAEYDPFDMFADQVHKPYHRLEHSLTSEPSAATVKQSGSFEKVNYPDTVTALNHYRELHRIATRIIWKHLQKAETTLPKEPDGLINLQLNVAIRPTELQLIRHYCSSNLTLSNTVSPDTINSIISRSFESVKLQTIGSTFSITELVDILAANLWNITSGLFLCLIIIIIIRFPHVLWLLLPTFLILTMIAQSFYKKYNQRLAEKMSVLSRYHSLPEECKPSHLQSWTKWISTRLTWRPAHDECARYFEHIVTEPWYATSLQETFFEFILAPITSFGKILGKTIGVFYDNMSIYIPPWFALLCTGFLLFSIFPMSMIVCRYLPARSRRLVSKRRTKKQVKSSSLPSISNCSSICEDS